MTEQEPSATPPEPPIKKGVQPAVKPAAADAPEAAGPPPLDLKVLLAGALRRWPVVVVGAALGVVAVHPVGKLMGKLEKKDYKTETILNFQPVGENARYVDAKTTVATLKDTVKTRENIAQIRERLGLSDPIDALGKAIDARVQKNTTLLVIEAKGNSPRKAADLANTARDVFLERYRARTQSRQTGEMEDLRRRLETVRKSLKDGDALLRSFTSANKIVDIDKESRALLEEYNNYGMLLEQAQAERKTVDEQVAQLDKATRELKARVARESQNIVQLESLSEVNTRLNRLRDAIAENKEQQRNELLLEEKKREFERAQRLYEKGFLSGAALEKAQTEYEIQKVATQDNAQVAQWKAERDRLQKRITPTGSAGAAPSAPILQTLLVRTFDLELQQIAVKKKVWSLEQARLRVKTRLDQMPGFQQQYESLRRNIGGRETERAEIEARLASKQRDIESTAADFSLVTAASAPPTAGANPIAKFVPLALPVVGGALGLLAALALSFLDPRLFSLAASAAAAGAPALGALPPRRDGDTRYAEALTRAAQSLRRSVPGRGALVALAAASHDDGAWQASVDLAGALGRQGERVALVDLRRSDDALALLWEPERPPTPAGQWLDGSCATVAEIAAPTQLPGVHLIARQDRDLSPDLLAGTRLKALCDSLGESFDIVLVAVAPVLSAIDAELVAHTVHAGVLVTACGKTRGPLVKRAVRKWSDSGIRLVGVLALRAPS